MVSFMRRSLLPLLFASLTVSAQEQSVKPGINEKFLDPSLKVEEWTERFETESREIFTQREAILKACGITEGMTIADIGAGTGLFTLPFARATGPSGKVHAVEIARKFLDHITARATAAKLPGIVPVLANPRSVNLPENSIDLAFICDVYHHFEYPATTLKSLVRCLKKGGTVVVIDFIRIEGVSSDWVLGHVRAGQEVFRKEIEDAGLTFVEEVKIDGFKENYFLRFTKP